MENTKKLIIGIDEVGYGAWAGPVYACAVCFPSTLNDMILDKIKDSKKLTKKQRKAIYSTILPQVLCGIGFANNQEVDQMNVKQATYLAMTRALENLKLSKKDLEENFAILIDGNSKPPSLENAQTIIKGDDKIKEISCASIIAKVTRDNLMYELHKEFPIYAWDSNVGYGTKKHIEAIKRHGVSKYHRISYKPFL